jgi:parallel beta-helix repeat protein
VKIRWLLAALLLTLAEAVALWGQATVKVAVQPGADIGAQVNAAIAALPNKRGTLELPAGSYTQLKTISVSGTGIHIIGAGSGTTLNYDPASYHLIDSADSSEGWHGLGVSVRVQTSIGEDHPDPMQGTGYIEAATTGGSDYRVSKTVPSTNFTGWVKLGIWVTLNLTGAQQDIQFFVSDGPRTAYWTVKPLFFYGEWKFYELDPSTPTGNDGGMPDLKNITVVGFRNLLPNAKYYFDAIALYKPTGPSIAFSSCQQCSLENVSIHWEPASQSDAAVSVTQNTRALVLDHVHTTAGAYGFELVGVSDNTCKACSAEFAAGNGFAIRGPATGNQLIDPEVTRNVNGIFIAQEANHNKIVSARCVRNNAAGILIDGNDNEINDTNIDTWMTFGLVIRGASNNNVITGVTARSLVGETAVQLLAGASHNTLTNIDIEAAGGNGLDLGGGGKPDMFNTATQVIVRNSGSSSWYGGPKGSSEGRGLCVCGADDNTISHMEIYDAGQRSTLLGAQGILIDGSNRNKLEDILISHSRKEGISIWHASGNQLINIRLVGNGLKEGGAGIRIEVPANNTVVENLCYWMNGGGGIKNMSGSSSIRNARQVKDLDPKQPCQ